MRSEILEQAIHDCLNEMYQKSQPSITFDEVIEKHKTGEYNEKVLAYERHYLPQEEYLEIEEKYIRAYRIHNEWIDDAELMIDYLEKGGTKDKWIPEKIHEDGFKEPGYRGYEKTPKLIDALKEFLSEEDAQKAYDKTMELMNNCKDFYNPTREENNFRFTIANYSPCCNKETVQSNYSDITIYERVYDPVNEEWVDVTPQQIEKWREELEEWNDEWFKEELTKLIDKYGKIEQTRN